MYAYCANNPICYVDYTGHEKDVLGQPSSTALAPYDPHFASEQRRRDNEIYYDANANRWRDMQNGKFVATPTSFMPPVHQPQAPKADTLTPKQIGNIGEYQLQQMYPGKTHAYFSTSTGGRFVDQLSDGVAHESKVGYTSLTSEIKRQILKDVEIFKREEVKGIQWHFFESPITGKKGPTPSLKQFLEGHGITVVEH